MNIVFRVDAALHIGSGHVMRCLALADELTKQGATCLFICRAFKGNLFSLIKERGYALYILPDEQLTLDIQPNQVVPHEHWLGINYDNDAKQTINILTNLKMRIDWLIIDHYAIDIRWEILLRPYTKKIMLIDDLADRKHDCDLLLDQNYFDDFLNRYNKLLPLYTKTLLGPEYVILNPTFQSTREQCYTRVNKHNQKQILVFFGGVDNTGETLKFLNAYQRLSCDYQLNVLIAKANPYKTDILSNFAGVKNITFYEFCDDMAQLMSNMDYAFGACGTTNWERMCIGLNSSIVSVADNQIEISHFLQKQGLIEYIGHADNVEEKDYIQAINLIEFDSINMMNRRERIMALIDGFGVNRISKFLLGS